MPDRVTRRGIKGFSNPFLDYFKHKKCKPRSLFILLFCLLLSPGSTSQAQKLTVNQQYDAAFLDMYEDIGNLDKTFRFAELAITVGDIEGAVAALERMLIIEPELPQIRMQLGALYFQLASYAMALTYLKAVVAHDEVPDDLKQSAQDLIAQIEALISPHRFNGTVVTGVRYQSNANGGPMTQNIRLFGGSAILNEQYTRQSDWDVSLVGQFNYVYDFQTEPSATLETGVSAYSSWQNTQSQVDTTIFELQVGPRFIFTPKPGTALDIRPYAVVNDMALGGKDSFEGVGAGLDLAFRTSMSSSWSAGTRYADRDYSQTDEAGLKGRRTRIFGGRTFGISNRTIGTINLNAFNEDTDEKSLAYWEYGVQAVIQHNLADLSPQPRLFGRPLTFTPTPWTCSFSVGFYDKTYDEANPGVDANVIRQDKSLRSSASLVIPLTTQLNLLTTAGYADVDSNLPNYTNENWFSSISVLGQF